MFKISFVYLLLLQSAIGFAQQNCIIIIADDVSPDYFASFGTTTDVAQTPNISALAQNGVRFTNAWATPVCSPTRAGLLTGRYSFRTGVGEVITNNATPQLDTAEVTIAELLQQHAPTLYNTGLVGKWHLHSNTAAKRLYPNRMGFDFYKGSFIGAVPDYYNYPMVANGATDTSYTYATTQTVNDALSWMDTMNATKPFFLCMAFNAPHSPYHLPPSSLCDVAGLTGTTAHINANKKLYFKAAIQALDTEIGRLVQYLNDNGFGSNTNIIFIGDNGNSQEVAQNGNTAHCKNTIYNYGVHVPLIVNGPAVVSPNRNCTALVNAQDIFATVAEICAFPNWRNAISTSVTIDSKSFLPHLQNQSTTAREWIFTEKFTSTPVATDGKTIRNNQYQILQFDNGSTEFYDLQADINQNTNLLSQTLSENQQLNYNSLCDSLNLLLGISSPCTNYQVALPISLLKFNGTHDDNKNILSWSSATEVNSEKYVVQRSTDAKIFEEIGIVQAGGNTNEIQNYQFTDEGVTERLYYYRLNMVDSDGKSALSHIISVTNNMVIGHFDVLQNPSNSILTIQYKDGALMHDTDVKLYDTNGKLIWQTILYKGQNMAYLDTKTSPSGMYALILHSRAHRESIKVFIDK